jgi:uncharacterized membrane-anchored protein
VRTHYRTGPRSAVSFGCLGSTVIGCLALAVIAVGGAVALGIVALILGVFVGWFAMWLMPVSLYRAFAKEFGGSTAGLAAVTGWFALCALAGAVLLWIL